MDYISFLEKLLLIPSTSGNEAAIARFLHHFLTENFDADRISLQEVSADRYNVILVKGKPRLTLSTHLDVVPGNVPVSVANGVITGRGACDAKGQIATQLWALDEAMKSGLIDYACFYVVGEEVDSCGAMAAARHPWVHSEYLLNGEPTDNQFVSASRGVIECVLVARGREKHSSLADRYSANHKLIRDLTRVLDNPAADTSINIGLLTGGTAPNVTAGLATADLCIRSGLPADLVIAHLAAILRETTPRLKGPPIVPFRFYVPKGFEHQATSVNFCSDAAIYAARFTKIMLFGPGSITFAHDAEEQITAKDIITGKNIIKELLMNL